jgi:hypothetical protein
VYAGDEDAAAVSRSGWRRLIVPFEYRHLRAVGSVRFAAGGFQLGIGVVLLGLGRRADSDQDRRKCYGWGAWFLGMAALQFLGGCMDMVADRRP